MIGFFTEVESQLIEKLIAMGIGCLRNVCSKIRRDKDKNEWVPKERGLNGKARDQNGRKRGR